MTKLRKKQLLSWVFFGFLLVVTAGLPDLKSPEAGKFQSVKQKTPAELSRERSETKRAKRLSGWAKPDRPDGFMDYENLIRTGVGQKSPGYQPGYLEKELDLRMKRARRLNSSYTWQQRGPWNAGGRTRTLVLDVTDPGGNTWFTGTSGGGIWKTTSKGSSWTPITGFLSNYSVGTLIQCASNPDVFYAGTGEGFGNADAIRGGGIFKSVDHGVSWSALKATQHNSDFSYVNRVIADPENPDILLAATNSGIFRSEDGGLSFSPVFLGQGKPVTQVISHPSRFALQYAAVKGTGILRSENGGKTWVPAGAGLSGSGRIEIGLSSQSENLVWLSADGGSKSLLYGSHDKGKTWQLTVTGSESWFGGQGWYNNCITIHPSDTTSVYIGGINVYRIQVKPEGILQTRLTDWYPASGLPYVHADHHGLFIQQNNGNPDHVSLISVNDGGVEYSEDSGASWKKTLNGYQTVQFYGIDKAPGKESYAGGTQDNGSWFIQNQTSEKDPWQNIIGGDGMSVAWHHLKPEQILTSLYYNILFKTENGGKNWTRLTTGPGTGPFITSLAESNCDPDLLFLIHPGGVYRSIDFGTTWALSPVNSGWGYNGVSGKVEISKHNPMIVWAGIGLNAPQQLIHLSQNGGRVFLPVSAPVSIGPLSGFATHPGKDSVAFALFSVQGKPKILRTGNLGETWEDLSGFADGTSRNGFPDVAVYSLVVLPHRPEEIWAGTEIGLYISEDSGKTWFPADGLEPVPVFELKVVDDQILLATHGRGLWTVTIPELTSVPLPPKINIPVISSVTQASPGKVALEVALSHPFDSIQVLLDARPVPKRILLPELNSRIVVPFSEGDSLVEVWAYKNGWPYRSDPKTLPVNMLQNPVDRLSLSFNQTADLKELLIPVVNSVTDFIIMTPPGFESSGLSTRHPYPVSRTLMATVKTPVIVSQNQSFLWFDHAMVIEPGSESAGWGTPEYKDYGLIEATRDGETWIPLSDGMNSRTYPDWLEFYGKSPGLSPGKSLLKPFFCDLKTWFQAGDTLIFRFRLFSDAAQTGWGWLIDHFQVQTAGLPVDESGPLPSGIRLHPAYPNPFNPATTLRWSQPVAGKAVIRILNLLGQDIQDIKTGDLPAGENHLAVSFSHQPSGVYFYRIEVAGRLSETGKLLLVK